MSSAAIILLLFYALLSSVISYKLPMIYGSYLTVHAEKLPLGINYQLEEASQLDEDSYIYGRIKRQIEDAKSTVYLLNNDMTSQSPLEETSDTTPNILDANSSPTIDSHTLLGEETTTLIIDPSTKENEVTDLLTTSTPDFLLTSTKSEELSSFTNTNPKTVTTAIHVQSTHNNEHISSIEMTTNDQLFESTPTTSVPKVPDTTSSKPPEILYNTTTEQDRSSAWIPLSSGPPSVTEKHVTVFSEDIVQTQSLIKQCMLTILILAVVCTVFIVTTIALAAKISALKQKQKRHNTNYTEMRCISSLLPENDQPGKAKPKRLKTFAANLEDNDGDDNTLNSFLPD